MWEKIKNLGRNPAFWGSVVGLLVALGLITAATDQQQEIADSILRTFNTFVSMIERP